MLRGNYTARIDPKGRLKVPTVFRRLFENRLSENHRSAEVKSLSFYVTSLTGECVRIYPLSEWEAIESRLAKVPSMDPARRKFLDRANYYGQQTEMDSQGRVLIHPLLRKSAAVTGEVAVLGSLTYIEVWELEKFRQRLLDDPYTLEDEAAIARLGI